MDLGPAEIVQYVEPIWGTVLSLGVQECAITPSPGKDCVTGCVQISGAWQGTITLDCPEALARQAAGILFGVDATEVASEQMGDTVGELTNMIGGNMKALLPGPCYLSLPAVANGSDYAFRVPGSRVVSRVGLECGNHPFVVTVIERDAKIDGNR